VPGREVDFKVIHMAYYKLFKEVVLKEYTVASCYLVIGLVLNFASMIENYYRIQGSYCPEVEYS